MPNPLNALDAACDFFKAQGGQLGLAAAIGVKSPSISGWRKALAKGNPRGIPQDRCEPIEAVTGGKARVEDLRPDLQWHRDGDGHVVGFVTPIRPTKRRRPAKARA